MAGGAEVAALAGEGEQFFVTTVWAVETGETGGEVAAAEKGLDGGGGSRAKWSESLTVVLFIAC